MISVVIIVRNAVATLAETLESLRMFDDVVLYDNGSTDGSQALARAFPNVRLINGYFDGFGATKNRAAGLARHDWILVLDADEALEDALAARILDSKLEENNVYVLNFRTFYKDREVRHCGWGNQKIRRLYNRKKTQFTSEKVHENIEVHGLNLQELSGGSVLHYSYLGMSDFIQKVDRYSRLYAQSNLGIKKSSPTKAVASGIYSFVRTYIFKRGFLDGYVGLVIAFSHMATNFYKYIRLYEANRDSRVDP